MNPKQQRAVAILSRLEAGVLDVGLAAELLGVGARQVRRLRARFRQAGMAAVIHGNRGRAPANRTAPAVVERIVALAGPAGKYHDLNTCHLQERLAQEEQIVMGRATLDRLLKAAGVRGAPGRRGGCIGGGVCGAVRKGCCCKSTVARSLGSRNAGRRQP